MPTNATARINRHAVDGVRAQFFVRGEPKPQGSARVDHIQGRFPDIVSGEGDKRKVDFTLLNKDELAGFVTDLRSIAQPA